MESPTEFARLSTRAHAPADRLLLALAAEFGPVGYAAAMERLDDLGRALFGIASLPAEAAARRLVAVLTGEAGLAPGADGPGALMLDRVLATGFGHPALLAATYLEVARRAGTELVLVAGGDAWYAGFDEPDELLLVSSVPLSGRPGPPLGLRRCCAHELAHFVLGELATRYQALGHKGQAAHARRLRALLPLRGPQLG